MSENGIILKYVSQLMMNQRLYSQEFKVRWVTLLHIFIHSADERIFNIGEHVAKLQAKWLTVSYASFALHFCPQRCRSRQISWITCTYYRQKLLLSIAVLIGRFVWVIFKKYQTAVDQFSLTDWQTDAISDWPTADHVQHFAATAFLCCSSSVQWVMRFFIWPSADVNNFLLVN